MNIRAIQARVREGAEAARIATGARPVLRACVILSVAAWWVAPASAAPALVQRLPQPPAKAMPDNLRMQSILFDAQQLAADPRVPRAQVRRLLSERNITMNQEGLVHVEVVGPDGQKHLEPAVIEALGGLVDTTWANRVDAWVPVERLRELAGVLPKDHLVTRADVGSLDDVLGQGPAAINSITYRNGGANGHGVTIAIIDEGYQALTAARLNGDVPPLSQTTQINLSANPDFETTFSSKHGTGCVEAIYDHCPGATFRLYKIDSLTDYGVAVADCISHGVDVISHSISRYNTGWADDSGAACQAVTQACNAGIIFITSAGNRALDHWEGSFSDSDANGWQNWDATGDEGITITVPALQTLQTRLAWNTAGGPYNYDIYLYDATMTTVLASSTNGPDIFEECDWFNSSPTPKTVNLGVRRLSGGSTTMEVFTFFQGGWEPQHVVALGSTTSPSNSTHPLCISVGAVKWGQYGTPPGLSVIYNYSSRGPSNSGMLLPDLSGPTDTFGFTFPTGFDGTSCATANTVGAVVAFLSSDNLTRGAGARHLIGRQAGIFRDWGAAGPDLLHGAGGTYLYNYAVGTAWIDRSFGPPVTGPASIFLQPPFQPIGTHDQTSPWFYSQPFYYVQDAQTWAPTNGRLVFLGQSYPEPVIMVKPLHVESIGATAHLGQ